MDQIVSSHAKIAITVTSLRDVCTKLVTLDTGEQIVTNYAQVLVVSVTKAQVAQILRVLMDSMD